MPPRGPLPLSVSTTEQAGVPFPRSFSRVYARTCFIAPSLGHISVTPVLVNQRRMLAVSLDLPPPLRETVFLGGHTAYSFFSCARIRGQGPRAGAQNHGSTRERPDARRLTRTRSCVHEPLRKSPSDRCRPLPLFFSVSPLFRVAPRYLSRKDRVDISQ